jgi:serine/threonine protein kinase
VDIDAKSPPFDQFRSIQRLSGDRRGPSSGEHARHQLYVARDKRTRANVLIKITTKPGLVYEQNLENEIATLTTINRELSDSRSFPLLGEHGRLPDGRKFLTMSLFDEWPLATTISPERIPARHVTHVRTAMEVASALADLHRLKIWHVDLNPMNILFRWEAGRPVVRIVDFESSYEVARHSTGVFYNPPTTTAFSAPEVTRQAPDGRADVFSLGAVLYTMEAGDEWTWSADARTSIEGDAEIPDDLKGLLLTAVDADPARRFPSMVAFRDALGNYLEGIWPGRDW